MAGFRHGQAPLGWRPSPLISDGVRSKLQVQVRTLIGDESSNSPHLFLVNCLSLPVRALRVMNLQLTTDNIEFRIEYN